MFWKKESKEKKEIKAVNWHELTDLSQLETIKEQSHKQPVLIYKHSTRCSISSMTLGRLERSWNEDLDAVKVYYLDLISYRQVSNAIADVFGVYHESPQVILIENGNAIYDDSHMAISAEGIANQIKKG